MFFRGQICNLEIQSSQNSQPLCFTWVSPADSLSRGAKSKDSGPTTSTTKAASELGFGWPGHPKTRTLLAKWKNIFHQPIDFPEIFGVPFPLLNHHLSEHEWPSFIITIYRNVSEELLIWSNGIIFHQSWISLKFSGSHFPYNSPPFWGKSVVWGRYNLTRPLTSFEHDTN